MLSLLSVSIACHTAEHTFQTETKDFCFSLGKKYVRLASAVICVRFNLHMYVALIFPSVRVTAIPGLSGCMAWEGALDMT